MTTTPETIRSSLEAYLTQRDREHAVAAGLDVLRSGDLSVVELYDVLTALLAGIGESWQRGDVEVWEEHFATGVVRTIVESAHPFVSAQAAEHNGLTIVLATPPDEYHDLGLRMLADRLTLAGWKAHFVGANVPAEQLIEACRATSADAAVISTSTHFHRLSLHAYVADVRAALPRLRVWVGGAAFATDTHDWPAESILRCEDIESLASYLRSESGEVV
jgi:methanogenic corrinoid protein MtbC1